MASGQFGFLAFDFDSIPSNVVFCRLPIKKESRPNAKFFRLRLPRKTSQPAVGLNYHGSTFAITVPQPKARHLARFLDF
jgi:hypothetical protein